MSFVPMIIEKRFRAPWLLGSGRLLLIVVMMPGGCLGVIGDQAHISGDQALVIEVTIKLNQPSRFEVITIPELRHMYHDVP